MSERYFAFISYSHTTSEWAATLQENLERCLEHYARTVDPSVLRRVYIDKVDLHSGESWVEQFQRAVARSDRLILVVTPEALESEWVKIEWQSFFAERPTDLFPVRLVDADLTTFLKPIHWIDFQGVEGKHYKARLTQFFGDLLRRERRDPPPMPDDLIAPTTKPVAREAESPTFPPEPEASSAAVPTEALAAAGFAPDESAGLFVGVSRFADERFTVVPYAVDDAIDLAHLFSLELGLLEPSKVVLALSGAPRKLVSAERLELLTDHGTRRVEAKQTDIYSLLGEQGRRSGSRGLFVASIATHGFSVQGGDFLVAADSLRRHIERTGVAVNELFDEVSRATSPRRLVLLDACREQLTAETRTVGLASPMSPGFVAAIARAQGQAVLSGATQGGFAYDDPRSRNGVFSSAVIRGLRGSAPTDSKGFVTVRTLADYVDAEVASWVLEHVPDPASRPGGIARRVEGAIETLPLAMNPRRAATGGAYRRRRADALAKLRENLDSTLTGAFYDRVMAWLPEEEPDARAEELLAEVEALDGTVRLRRALVFYLESLQTRS